MVCNFHRNPQRPGTHAAPCLVYGTPANRVDALRPRGAECLQQAVTTQLDRSQTLKDALEKYCIIRRSRFQAWLEVRVVYREALAGRG